MQQVKILPPKRRRRSFILTPNGLEKLQPARVTFDRFGYRQTFEVLAGFSQLSPRTVAKIISCTQGVDFRTLKQFFQTFGVPLERDDYTMPVPPEPPTIEHYTLPLQQDLQEAVEVPVFYGRRTELQQLKQWIVHERCRMVTLLGMGGIGKTALSVKLTQQLQSQFEFVVWKSLRNAPPLSDLLGELLPFLSQQQATPLPDSVGTRLLQLLRYLRQQRCLLVLDNVEVLFQGRTSAGAYREGYSDYGELFRQVAETLHNSCLVLTSREQPKEVKLLESATTIVRTLVLRGLNEREGRFLFQERGSFFGTDANWQEVIEYYAGNPMVLRIVAAAIQEYLGGDLNEFVSYLKQGRLLFGEVRDLLEQQFGRLSTQELQVMYWLSVNRDWVSLAQVQAELVPKVGLGELWSAIDSLLKRCLIEKWDKQLILQPVVMEYVTERLIEQMCQEIITQELNLFKSHALMNTNTKDLVRDTQVHLILKPIIARLMGVFGSKEKIKNQLTQILVKLQDSTSLETGYTGENVLNLLSQLETDVQKLDFSHLTFAFNSEY